MFASGRGSNFEALARAARGGSMGAKLVLLISDNPDAYVIKRALRHGVSVVVVKREDFSSRQEFERAIQEALKRYSIDLIVLAGFMRMLSPGFVKKYRLRILNIHPALLPAFKGSCAIKDAFDYGVRVTGVTVHFVDEKMDHGPIILQEALPVRRGETLASLEARIHKVEHRLYPAAVRLFCKGRLRVAGRKVVALT